MDAAGNNPMTFRSVVRRMMAPKSRMESIDRLNEIRHTAGRTVLSPKEHAECWSIIRGFSVQDVEACLVEIPIKLPRVANSQLMGMLFFRWAQLDPLAAVEAASGPAFQAEGTTRGGYSNRASVLAAWAAKDPEAVLRWAAASDIPFVKYQAGKAAGKVMGVQDPEGGVDKAMAILPDSDAGLVVALAQGSKTSEERRELLARLSSLPDPKALDYYLNFLAWNPIQQGSQASPEVIEDVDRASIPPEKVAKFRDSVLDSLRSQYPAAGIELMQQSAPETSKKDQQFTYFQWALNYPEEATVWAVEQGRSDLAANLVQSSAANLMRSGWMPETEETSSSFVKGVVGQFHVWRKLEPEAANAWLQTMPSDIRNYLSDDHAPR